MGETVALLLFVQSLLLWSVSTETHHCFLLIFVVFGADQGSLLNLENNSAFLHVPISWQIDKGLSGRVSFSIVPSEHGTDEGHAPIF